MANFSSLVQLRIGWSAAACTSFCIHTLCLISCILNKSVWNPHSGFLHPGTAHMKSNQRRPCQNLPAPSAPASRILSLSLCGKGWCNAKKHTIVLSSLFGNSKWNFDVPVLIICCAINHMRNCQQLHQLRSMEVAWERSTAVAIVELILFPNQLMGKLSSWMYLSLRVSLSLSLLGKGRQQSQ